MCSAISVLPSTHSRIFMHPCTSMKFRRLLSEAPSFGRQHWELVKNAEPETPACLPEPVRATGSGSPGFGFTVGFQQCWFGLLCFRSGPLCTVCWIILPEFSHVKLDSPLKLRLYVRSTIAIYFLCKEKESGSPFCGTVVIYSSV